MTIAELFVNLGVKGADKSRSALGSVKTGLGEVKSMSLEAKAAIVAVVYGLERMMAGSAAAGTGFSNFASLTGLSVKALQQWQYAARQVGVTGEEVEGSIKGVQNAMSNMLTGKGAPEGMAMVANKVGFDPKKARDSFYVLEQLQKFAKSVPQDVGNAMIKSFGVSEGVIAAMRKNAFRPEVFAKAPSYSDNEVSQLNKVDVAWSNLGQKINMAFGHFTAQQGLKIVNDLSKITTQVLRLVEALLRLSDTLKVFKVLGAVLEGVAKTTEATANVGQRAANDKQGVGHGIFEAFAALPKTLSHEGGMAVHKMLQDVKPVTVTPESALPSSIQNNKTIHHNKNTSINQTITHHGDAKDTKAVKDTHKRAIQDAYRQVSAQGQVN